MMVSKTANNYTDGFERDNVEFDAETTMKMREIMKLQLP